MAEKKISMTLEELEDLKAELKAEIMASMKENAAPVDDSPKTTQELEELVPVYLFKDANEYKDDLSITINGKNIVVKRGMQVMVPKKYAMVLEQSMQQDQAAAEYCIEMQEECRKAVESNMI